VKTIVDGPRPGLNKKLDKHLAHSLAWRAATNWASQLVSWASLFVVVRLLTPADFGIVAMAVVLFPYLRILGEFGIPQTIVNLRDLTEEQLAQLNTVSLMLSMGCFGIAVALAWPLALFFRTPRLAPVVIVTCIGLIPLGFRSVSEGLLSKEMQFRTLSWFEAIRAVIAAAVTLFLAFMGFGYWALVLGNLVATFARTILLGSSRPQRFAMPRMATLKKPLSFGRHILVSVIALSAYERLDNVTAGRMLGQTALGFYGLAWNLAYVPLEKVTSLVTTVIPTYLAAVQKEPESLRRYVRTLTEALALATFPATIGLGIVACEVVPVALGVKWVGVIAPLQVLSIYAAFRSIVAIIPKVLTAVGNARFVMWNDLRALVILPIAFYIGSHWGTAGIAWGWVAAYPLVAAPLYWKAFKTIKMPVATYLQALRPAIDGTVMMVLAVLALRWTLPPGWPAWIRLITEVALGGVVYFATLLLVHRKRIMAFVGMAKSFRRAEPTVSEA
jgi:O-antigen/teichoic acid export membrane protein